MANQTRAQQAQARLLEVKASKGGKDKYALVKGEAVTRVAGLLKAGKTITGSAKEVAAWVNEQVKGSKCHYVSVQKWAEKAAETDKTLAGLISKAKASSKTYTDADRERAIDLLIEGKDFAEIAEDIGCTAATVETWCNNYVNEEDEGDE